MTTTARLEFALSLASCLFMFSCAQGGGGGGEAQADQAGGTYLETMNLEARDLQFASHIVLQLADVRRTLDDAQTLFPNTRQQSRPGDFYEFGCRVMKKISPDPETSKPTTLEKFAIVYNCVDSAPKFARVDLDGSDLYHVGFDAPLPKQGEAKERPLATSVTVTGATTYTAYFAPDVFSADDVVRVARKTTTTAHVSTATETDLIFDVDHQVDDDYDFDVSKTHREGLFSTKIMATVTVDKKTRKVRAIAPYFMSVSVDGKQWKKSGVGRDSGRSEPTPLALANYEFQNRGPVRLNPDSCLLPDVNLAIMKQAGEIQAKAEGGKISVESGESQLKACEVDRAADPLYAQVLEGMYF